MEYLSLQCIEPKLKCFAIRMKQLHWKHWLAQIFASGEGDIVGVMVLVGAGIAPGGQASSYLCYYWPHGEKFNWKDFFASF